MTDHGVVVLGIPIPSSTPLFLGIVAVHVAGGLVCAVAGIVAMLAPKLAGRHPTAGTVYYGGLVVVSVTMASLALLRWPENTHLFVLGIVSFGAGTVGRAARRGLWREWLRWHIAGMAISYSRCSRRSTSTMAPTCRCGARCPRSPTGSCRVSSASRSWSGR